ncbi:hypothetical protein SAVIM338S_00486 [Streptomyces avidinii]
MKNPGTTRTLARLVAGLPLIVAPLLLTAGGPAYADPEPQLGNPCAAVSVPLGHRCVPEPKQCFVPPCPQYAIIPVSPLSPLIPISRLSPLSPVAPLSPLSPL